MCFHNIPLTFEGNRAAGGHLCISLLGPLTRKGVLFIGEGVDLAMIFLFLFSVVCLKV